MSPLTEDIHSLARENGFWDDWDTLVERISKRGHLSLTAQDREELFPFIAYKLTMIHSEVTEVMEAIRKDKGEDEISTEFADILIRCYDLYEALYRVGMVWQPDLEKVVREKHNINLTRPRKHGVAG